MRRDPLGHVGGKSGAIDRERAASGNRVALGCRINLRAEQGKLALEHAGGALRLRAFKGVRAHEFSAVRRHMDGRRRNRAHLHKPNANAAVGKLQRGLASRKPGSKYGYR